MAKQPVIYSEPNRNPDGTQAITTGHRSFDRFATDIAPGYKFDPEYHGKGQFSNTVSAATAEEDLYRFADGFNISPDLHKQFLELAGELGAYWLYCFYHEATYKRRDHVGGAKFRVREKCVHGYIITDVSGKLLYVFHTGPTDKSRQVLHWCQPFVSWRDGHVEVRCA